MIRRVRSTNDVPLCGADAPTESTQYRSAYGRGHRHDGAIAARKGVRRRRDRRSVSALSIIASGHLIVAVAAHGAKLVAAWLAD